MKMSLWERLAGIAGVLVIMWVIEKILIPLPHQVSPTTIGEIEVLVMGLIAGSFLIAEIAKMWRVLGISGGARFEWKDGLMLLLCLAVSLLIYMAFSSLNGGSHVLSS